MTGKRRPQSPGVRPFQNAYGGTHNPFAPIVTPHTDERERQAEAERLARGRRVERFNMGVYSLIGVSDWTPFFRWDTSDFTWGQMFVGVQTNSPPAADPFVQNHGELRVVGSYAGALVLLFEGASCNEAACAPGAAAGPVYLPIREGFMPDSIELFARGRAGTAASVTPSEPTQDRIDLYATGRFHR